MGTLHVIILLCTVAVILYADHYALGYVRGTKSTLDPKRMHYLHIAVYAGLAGMIASGVTMVAPYWRYFISDTAFLVKMGFVAVLVVNSVFISHLMHHAYKTPFAELSKKTKYALFLSGAASTLGWLGAITMGVLFFG